MTICQYMLKNFHKGHCLAVYFHIRDIDKKRGLPYNPH